MKKLLLLILLTTICWQADARYTDTVFQYFDHSWKRVNGKKDPFAYFRIARKTEDNEWHVRDYYSDTRSLQSEGICLDDSMTIQHGEWFYYYNDGTLKQESTYYKNNLVGLSRSYNIDGRLIDSSRYKSTGIPYHKSFHWDDEGRLMHYGEFDMKGSGAGRETAYYEDSTINATGIYAVGYVKDSIWSYYHPNGKLSFQETYDSGKLVSYQCFDTNGVVMTEKCDTASTMPEPGYNIYRYMGENTDFPEEAMETLPGGTFVVTVVFFVERDGTVTHPYVELGSFDFFNEEALRVVRSFPRWRQPGRAHNRAVKVYYTLPVTFKFE